MLIRTFIVCVLVSYIVTDLQAQSNWVEWKEDISETEDISNWQEQYEFLSELAEHPFNINTVTKEQLEQLPFLSDQMIENILYYIYKYGPMVSKKELLGIEGMDWQTRKFLEDFIYIGEAEKEKDKFWWKDVLKYNKQELLTRVDIPLYMKSGYADYNEKLLENIPTASIMEIRSTIIYVIGFSFEISCIWDLQPRKMPESPFSADTIKKGTIFILLISFYKI